MTAPTIVKPLNALRDFINAYIVPVPDKIYRGWQNRTTTELVTNYAVLTLMNSTRQGTNVHEWITDTDADFTETVKMLTLHDIQVDFCAEDDQIANAQAVRFCMLMRDSIATDFLADYGLSVHYAEDPRAMPFVERKQWEVRYTLTVRLASWAEAEIPLDDFTAVNVNLEEVGVHHDY